MALTAVTVGLSGCSSMHRPRTAAGARLLAILVFIVARLLRAGGLDELIGFLHASATPTSHRRARLPRRSRLYLGWSCLDLGASLIAPPAENHARPARLVALGLMPSPGRRRSPLHRR